MIFFNLITGKNTVALMGSCLLFLCFFIPNGLKAQVLFDNGPISNGTNSASQLISELYTTTFAMGAIGFGHQITAFNGVADDFTVTGTWQIDSIVFFGYQTGSSTASTFTDVRFRVWDSVPVITPLTNVVYGDSITNRLSATRFSNVYRVTSTTLTNTTRPIMRNVCTAPGLILSAGTYWLDWRSGGSLASGPWAPPIVPVGLAATGNGRQKIGNTWNNALDGGTGTPPQGFPFIIYGTQLAPTFTTNPSSISACDNGTASFSIAATNSPTAYQWEENTGSGWNTLTDGGVYTNVTTANLTISNPPVTMNGYLYRCIATNTYGSNTSDSAILTVSASAPAPTIMASNNNPCGGTQVTLTAVSPSGYTGLEYLWSKNGTPVNYQNGGAGTYTFNSGTVNASNDYTLQVVYSGISCLSISSATATVVTSTPDAIITPNGPTTFCANTPTTLNATAGMNSYVWKRSTAIVAVGSSQYTPVLSGNHSVTVTDANGCSKTSLWTNVTVNPLPTANAGADRIACLGSTVQIGGSNNVANSYAWSPTTGLSNPSISNPTASPTSTTTYTVTVTNNTTGCSKTDAVLVTVNAIPPTPTISSVISGTNAVLTVSSVSASSVNWYRNGALHLSNRPANGSITVPLSSPAFSYTAKSRGTNGCLSSASNFVLARTGDEKDGDLIIELDNNLMTAYPNPTTGNLQVEIQNTEIVNGILYLYNSLGQMVFSQNVELVNGSAKLSLDLTNVASGVYSLSFEKEVVKVIKE